MTLDNKLITKRQEEVTADYNKANKLNSHGLADLDGNLPEDENENTQDYLKAARRNAISPIASPKFVDADEDDD